MIIDINNNLDKLYMFKTRVNIFIVKLYYLLYDIANILKSIKKFIYKKFSTFVLLFVL